MSKPKLDTEKIAKGLGAQKGGVVYATGGFPGAARLAAEVQARFQVPSGGGRRTDPRWSQRRLVPLAPRTLRRLERLAKRLHDETGTRIEPMQLAGILLETTTESMVTEDAKKRVSKKKANR